MRKTLLSWLFTLLPLAYLIVCLIRYSVDVPFWDQWSLVPLIEKSYDGTLTLRDLLAQHNEHRAFFPKLWMLALIRLTSWNVAYDLAGILLLAIVLFALLCYQVRQTFRLAGYPQPAWLVPILSAMIFSLQQWPNWFHGHHTDIVMTVPPTLLGFFLLASPRPTLRRLLAALALGIIATFSFSNGLLYWPIGWVMLWIVLRGIPQRRSWLSAWALLGGGIILAYLWAYNPPAVHAPLGFGLKHPAVFLRYVLTYLGNPLLSDHAAAMWAGAAGIGLLIWSWQTLKSENRVPVKILLPYGALALYALGTACLTAVGRVGLFGSAQALAGRYIIYSNLLWVAACICLALIARSGSPRWAICHLAIGTIFLLAAFSSIRALRHLGPMHENLTSARTELLQWKDMSTLRFIYPKPEIVRKLIPILQKRHLSVFRNLTT